MYFVDVFSYISKRALFTELQCFERFFLDNRTQQCMGCIKKNLHIKVKIIFISSSKLGLWNMVEIKPLMFWNFLHFLFLIIVGKIFFSWQAFLENICLMFENSKDVSGYQHRRRKLISTAPPNILLKFMSPVRKSMSMAGAKKKSFHKTSNLSQRKV